MSGAARHPITGPDRLISAETLGRMHEAAVAMLTKTGMLVENAEVREAIANRKGFKLEGGRVKVPEKGIAALVKKLRESAAPVPPHDPDAPLGLGIDTRASFIVDRDGKTVRPMTRADVIDSAKLVGALKDRGVSGTTTGLPTDVPRALAPLEQYLVAAEFSPEGGKTNDVMDAFTAGVIRDMDQVYGRGFGRTVWSPSPLILGGPELDMLWHFREEVESVYVGSMPTMGGTAPGDPIGCFTVSVAETLGGAVILQELLPKCWIEIGPHPEPADLATGAMMFGTPEWELLDMMHRDVHGYYGRHSNHKLIHTTAPLPGPQAAADHAGSMMLGMAYGYTSFSPAGMLSLDEVYSPAMLVMDAEIMAHTQRVGRGVWSGGGLDLAELPGVVDEVIREGEVFMGHAGTPSGLSRIQDRKMGVFRIPRTGRIQGNGSLPFFNRGKDRPGERTEQLCRQTRGNSHHSSGHNTCKIELAPGGKDRGIQRRRCDYR